MRHIISVILEDEAGALSRVSGLFTQRGFNIESLTVAQTNDPTLSRMTIVSSGSERVLVQIVKQLNKLIEVVKVTDLTSQDHVERELMLAKISSTSKEGVDLKELVEIFGCKVVDVKDKIYTIEVSGKTKKIDAFLVALEPSNIIEISKPTFKNKGLNTDPYEISADRGIQIDQDIELYNIFAKFTDKNEKLIYITADKGFYSQDIQLIELLDA